MIKHSEEFKREAVRIVEHDRSPDAGIHSIRRRPFKVGLIVFLGDKIKISRNRRKELSDAMEYAYRHRVPSKHFNGFVKQAGMKRIAARAATSNQALDPREFAAVRNRAWLKSCQFPYLTLHGDCHVVARVRTSLAATLANLLKSMVSPAGFEPATY